MVDYSIKTLTVSNESGVNAALQPVALYRVTFYVGARGPFFLSYSPADYTPDKVIADVNAEVDRLKKIDAGVGLST